MKTFDPANTANDILSYSTTVVGPDPGRHTVVRHSTPVGCQFEIPYVCSDRLGSGSPVLSVSPFSNRSGSGRTKYAPHCYRSLHFVMYVVMILGSF